ncbi:hypothetical protein ACOSQ3_027160 [Xanthoceras sorbifolium]
MWKPRQTWPHSFAMASFLLEHISFGQQNQFCLPSNCDQRINFEHLQNFQIATNESQPILHLGLYVPLRDGDKERQGRTSKAKRTRRRRRLGTNATVIGWVKDLLF